MATYKIPVKITYAGGGSPGVNVFHARVEDADADLGDCLSALAAFYTSLKVLMKTTTQITIGTSMIRDPYGAPTYIDDRPTVINGQATGSALSPLLCYCINWKTTSATRSGRGRTFIGPLEIANNEADGTPGASQLAIVRNAATALVSASQGVNGWGLGVYSQKQGLLRDFTGASVSDKFAYLSSRRD